MRKQDEKGRVEFAEMKVKEEAKKEEKLEIGKKLKSPGADLQSIVKVTGLSIEEIEML